MNSVVQRYWFSGYALRHAQLIEVEVEVEGRNYATARALALAEMCRKADCHAESVEIERWRIVEPTDSEA